MRSTQAVSGILLAAISSPAAWGAGLFDVNTTADAGPGSLRQAILDANTAGGGTINVSIGGLVSLAAPLPIVCTPLTLNGNSLIVSGANHVRPFFIDAPSGAPVNLSNLVVTGGLAKGGDGGTGAGGGLGAGGAVFLNAGSLTLANVAFTANSAAGGKGGSVAPGPISYGGGGGLGGNGGDAPMSLGGGGGGFLADGGGFLGGGGGLDAPGQTNAGDGGGQGGSGPTFGGGHGFDGVSGGGGGSITSPGGNASATRGGDGGRYGGGGGSKNIGGNGGDFGGGGGGGGDSGATGRAGIGGFGGGGGAGVTLGGNGGFGGGGGGGGIKFGYGLGGAFGGNAGPGGTNLSLLGGGGGALGAHVFVRPGANITFLDVTADAGTLTPGAGGTTTAAIPSPGESGQAAGSAFFLSGPSILAVSAGQTRVISGTIVDIGANSSAGGFLPATLIKSGTGTLTLLGANTFTAGVTLSQGALNVVSGGALPMTGPVTFNDANTAGADNALIIGPFAALTNPVTVAAAPGTGRSTLVVAAGPGSAGASFSGPITLNRDLIVSSTSAPATPTNFPGTIAGAGGLVLSGGGRFRFFNGNKNYTGSTLITANSTLLIPGEVNVPQGSPFQIDAGSTLLLNNVQDAHFPSITGGGVLANDDSGGAISHITVGDSSTATHLFSGTITGRIVITKAGNDTLTLGPQSNPTLGLVITSGRIAFAGDMNLVGLIGVDKQNPGSQTLDLAGHTWHITHNSLALNADENYVNQQVGTAADGIFDSTADANHAVGVWRASASQLTVKLTLLGDANVDGHVDFSDLVILAQNYNTPSNGWWSRGDFNRDGTVNFADLVSLAQNYNTAVAGASFESDLAAAFASAPEPATGSLLPACAMAALARRRRHLQ